MQQLSCGAGSLLVAALVLACAKPVVEVAADADFSGYETWDWLPRRDPLGAELQPRPELHERVTAQVERELRARGYRRVQGVPPDFFVTYHLELQAELVVRRETAAEEALETFQQGGSYDITRTTTHVARYERVTLAIDAAEGRERQLVWRGQLEERVRGRFDRRAADCVAEILESFPSRTAGD